MTSLNTVQDHMKGRPATLRPDMEVEQAVVFLLKHRVSGVPVVDDDGNIVGILAERDCLQAFLNDEYCQCPTALVSDLMSSNVVTVDAHVDILNAAELFAQIGRAHV